jgi:hypothetical protein
MAFSAKRSATIVCLLILSATLAHARVFGVQSCKPVIYYGDPWIISIGNIGNKQEVACFKTAYTQHLCCDQETKTSFEGCELADQSGSKLRCWGEKNIKACCTL